MGSSLPTYLHAAWANNTDTSPSQCGGVSFAALLNLLNDGLDYLASNVYADDASDGYATTTADVTSSPSSYIRIAGVVAGNSHLQWQGTERLICTSECSSEHMQ